MRFLMDDSVFRIFFETLKMGKQDQQRSEPESDVEFDDWLVKLFWTLHRFKCLQWVLLLLIRLREKLDIHKFIKKPITKEVDDMDNCHFRTLYKQNHFNDNYTDPDFLCSMQLNTNLNYYTLGEAIFATSRVSLHLCPCILYFIMYYHLRHDNLSPDAVFRISLFSTLFGYGALQLSQWLSVNKDHSITSSFWVSILEEKMQLIWSDCMKCVCCGGLSYLLVPILRTVTQSVDTRTVHAVCNIMFGVHLLCNDYGLKAAVVSTPLSMNSAIFSVICLASRLQTNEHCLALMFFGVMSFICYPQWSQNIAMVQLNKWTSSGAAALIVIVTFGGYTISLGMAVFIGALIFMIVVVSPILYVCYVQYKFNILGPWDEARPELHVDMDEIERGFEKRRRSKRESSSNTTFSTEEYIFGGNGYSSNNHVNEGASTTSSSAGRRGGKEEEKIAEMEAKGIGLIL